MNQLFFKARTPVKPLLRWLFLLFLATSLNHFISLPSALAQEDSASPAEDDAYDPFADFSEFEPSADEEADIHFFKNGRFFNMALLGGMRAWTQSYGQIMPPAPALGFYIAYFFDIRSALQVSYVNSTHNFNIPATNGFAGLAGTANLSTISLHYKYYFNTANITRGFADLNPYLIGGVTFNYRTITLNNQDVLIKSNPMGADIGAGLEIPFSRNKMYFGVQALYHYATFADENKPITNPGDGTTANIVPRGDYIDVLLAIGVNF